MARGVSNVRVVPLSASAKTTDKTEQIDPYEVTLDRLASLTVLPLPAWRYHEDIPHPEDTSLSDETWPQVKIDERWRGPRVLRLSIRVPKKINGYCTKGAALKLETSFRSGKPMNIFVFSNGALAAHFDHQDMQQPITLTESSYPGRKFLIAVRLEASLETHSRIADSRLRIEPPESRPNPEIILKQILSLRALIAAYPEGQIERRNRLDAALHAIDLGSLDRGEQEAFDESLRRCQDILETFKPWLTRFSIRAIGNAHIDMAWLWPWTETVEVVRNTFRSALSLIREYPEFRFTMSSAQAYIWMEEKYPDLFREIQQRVQEGRWEIVGGMWVEPDLNMPGGESLVRQILTAKRYFLQKFKVDVKIGWNPDTFGYSWQLPQIYRKSGIDSFVTTKLLWVTEFTKFPHKMFWWESPDGSRILTYFPQTYGGPLEPQALARELSEWAPSIYGAETKTHSEIMHLYGVGDHGGGPTRDMLDTAIHWMESDVVFPALRFSTASEFFADLHRKIPEMQVPVWRDELYFEYHRGVFTTQARSKFAIRKTEELLLNTEKFASIAALFGNSYPHLDLQTCWRGLLFQHFHDIMPGAGIAINYVDAERALGDVCRNAKGLLNLSFNEIAARVDTAGRGVPVIVFNPLSWSRNELIEVEVQLPAAAKHVQVVHSDGKKAPAELIGMDDETHRARIRLLATVPAFGYSTYFVRATRKPVALKQRVRSTRTTLENEYLQVTVDPRSGCIVSLFDKQTGVDALSLPESDTGGPKNFICGNLLQAFRDEPKEWDAWNIDADFENEYWNLDQADDVALIENTPLRAMIRVKKRFRNSSFVQDIILDAASRRVDVRMTADWKEKHILLKVSFPLSAHSENATFEIPYGSIGRPTTRRTPAEQAKFEVPAIHWADISCDAHGFSLLNDSKYGYDAKANVLRLSLLRSPTWPDPDADQGIHTFTYSLYPHAGSWREALTVRKGYELNYPLIPVPAQNHKGVLPGMHSFFRIDSDNVVLTALKKAEDGEALILRFYEWAGKQTDATIHLPCSPVAAFQADLLERPLRELSLRASSVTITTRPYEIQTIRLEL